MGEVINGYELLEPFQNRNAGFSRWTLALRRQEVFFLKEFMNPVYPGEDIAENLRQMRIDDCKEFEEKKSRLYQAINRASDGNMIRIVDFFRYNSHYYIATPRAIDAKLSFEEIAMRPMEDRVLLCRTLANSMKRLHEAGIVHSDIKATNVIVQKTATGKLCAKLVDFGSSFFEAEAPESEDELGGDQVYLAPEACRFIFGEPVKLNSKIDVFALGLLFHQYLTGSLPGFDNSTYDYAYEAVLDGQQLVVSSELPQYLGIILQQMLLCEPEARCCIAEVFDYLGMFLTKETSPMEEVNSQDEEAAEEVDWSAVVAAREKHTTSASPADFFHAAGDL